MKFAPRARSDELVFLSTRFKISKKAIQDFVSYYNEDFSKYDNDIYDHIGSRIAHWWNYANHRWFDRRIDIGLDQVVKLIKLDRVLLVDVGFSVPYAYTDLRLAKSNRLSQLLIDRARSAKRFTQAISDLYGVDRAGRDKIVIGDVQRKGDQENMIAEACKLSQRWSCGRTVVMASELIEHLDSPEAFWSFVRGLQTKLKTELTVYATLPIGNRIPSHTLEFATGGDALAYLGERMNIERQWLLQPSDRDKVSPYLRSCICAWGHLQP